MLALVTDDRIGLDLNCHYTWLHGLNK